MKQIKQLISFNFTDIIFIMIFISLSLTAGYRIFNFDGDFYWHTVVGRTIVDTHTIPTNAIFSFVEITKKWINHEWLADGIFGYIEKQIGLKGVALFAILLLSLTFAIGFNYVSRIRKQNIWFSLLSLAACAYIMIPRVSGRPYVFSFLFFIILFILLENFMREKSNKIFYFIPIQVIWANLHGSFVSAILIMGIYLIELLLNSKKDWARIKKLILIISISLLVPIFNPFGIELFRSIIGYFDGHIETIIQNTGEFKSPDFHAQYIGFYNVVLMGIFIIAALTRKIQIRYVLILAFWQYQSLKYGRFIFKYDIFALMIYPIILTQFYTESIKNSVDTIMKRLKISKGVAEINRIMEALVQLKSLHIFPVITVIAVFAFANQIVQYDKTLIPEEIKSYIRANKEIRIFPSDVRYGGELIYLSYPNSITFIDGRTEMYGPEHFNEFLKVTKMSKGWMEIINKHDINYILAKESSIINRGLEWAPQGWEKVIETKEVNLWKKRGE